MSLTPTKIEPDPSLVQPCGHVHDTMEASAWCDIMSRMQQGLMNDYIGGFFDKYKAELEACQTEEQLKALPIDKMWDDWNKEFEEKVKQWSEGLDKSFKETFDNDGSITH